MTRYANRLVVVLSDKNALMEAVATRITELCKQSIASRCASLERSRVGLRRGNFTRYWPLRPLLREPLWNRTYVQSVQITMAESLGLEGRGRLYEATGAIRDVI